MNTIDITAIILTMIGMVSGWVSFYLDRHKHRQEVQGMKRDNQLKEMDLAKKYVDEYDRTIAQRLRNDVNELRNELNQMKDVLHKIQVCPYLAECPVLDELLEQQKGSKPDADQPEA